VQSVPSYSPTKIIMMIKSITAREVFARVPIVKKQLWDGEFWTDGYYVSSVGHHATEEEIRQSVKNQGQDGKGHEFMYLHIRQLKLFQQADTPSAWAGVIHCVSKGRFNINNPNNIYTLP